MRASASVPDIHPGERLNQPDRSDSYGTFYEISKFDIVSNCSASLGAHDWTIQRIIPAPLVIPRPRPFGQARFILSSGTDPTVRNNRLDLRVRGWSVDR